MYSIKETVEEIVLNTAIIALPLAWLSVLSRGLALQPGVVGAIVLGLVAYWLGVTPLLITGSSGPMTVVRSLIITEEIERAPDHAAAFTKPTSLFFSFSRISR